MPKGTLFPWTVSDFSLMDAIESGIVKLPRVPVSDDVSHEEMPRFSATLWEQHRETDAEEGTGERGGAVRSGVASSPTRNGGLGASLPLRRAPPSSGALWESRCRRCSSSSATTRRRRSCCTTTSPDSSARSRTDPPALGAVGSSSSATTARTANASPGRGPC